MATCAGSGALGKTTSRDHLHRKPDKQLCTSRIFDSLVKIGTSVPETHLHGRPQVRTLCNTWATRDRYSIRLKAIATCCPTVASIHIRFQCYTHSGTLAEGRGDRARRWLCTQMAFSALFLSQQSSAQRLGYINHF